MCRANVRAYPLGATAAITGVSSFGVRHSTFRHSTFHKGRCFCWLKHMRVDVCWGVGGWGVGGLELPLLDGVIFCALVIDTVLQLLIWEDQNYVPH